LVDIDGDMQQETLAAELVINPTVKALVKAALALDAKEKELTEQLDELSGQAGRAGGESWGEAMSLIEALEAAPDPRDARLRLRLLLRQHVAEIWILVVPRSKTRRVAAVQVFFESGACRHYLIASQDAGYCRQGGWWACALDDAVKLGPRDLRQRVDAHKLETLLAGVNLEKLLADVQKQPTLKRGGGKL
jgi:hypothetical protein